jgi:hypothetical protein
VSNRLYEDADKIKASKTINLREKEMEEKKMVDKSYMIEKSRMVCIDFNNKLLFFFVCMFQLTNRKEKQRLSELFNILLSGVNDYVNKQKEKSSEGNEVNDSLLNISELEVIIVDFLNKLPEQEFSECTCASSSSLLESGFLSF